ncbi:MAG: hypothetical protein FJW20_05635 [Acidimicrobiia bacterium]|nr:hypothetical protein [Acidimicrobiia bacterium]
MLREMMRHGANSDWIRQMLGQAPPVEITSDCTNCVMVKPEGESIGAQFYFDPDVRCCTYEPALPNYIAGRILRDSDPERAAGRASLEARMARRVDTLPWGIRRSKRFDTLYGSNAALFGRAADLGCPHLTEGSLGCGIWPYRPGVCSTWYCKHDRGQTGHAFWNNLALLLREVELMMGAWCVAELHGGRAAMRQALNPEAGIPVSSDLGGEMDEKEYGKLWGNWAGKEAEFFQACAAKMDDIRWEDVERIGGVRMRTMADLTRTAFEKLLDMDVPQRLQAGPFRILASSRGKRTVETYSGFNPIKMPEALFRALPYFDGRPTAESIAEIRTKEKLRLQPALVRRLADFGILEEIDT